MDAIPIKIFRCYTLVANRLLQVTSLCASRHAWHVGSGVGIGNDHTLYALIEGKVVFCVKGPKKRRTVCVEDRGE